MKWPILFNLIVLILILFKKVKCDKNSTFVPAKEWKIIQEGQMVPQGIHVRINMATGLKEGKLLDPNENNPEEKSSIQVTSKQKLSKEKNFRTIDQINKILKETGMKLETGSNELLKDLMERYKKLEHKTNNTEEILNILEDFDYLVHQIDTALHFIDNGGVETIIFPNLINQTDPNIKVKTLNLLGSLAQNNAKAKIKLFEKNTGQILLNLLAQAKEAKEISMGVFAFGSLMRKFPFAQKEILSKSGFNVLLGIVQSRTDLKVKIKTLTLLSDISKDFKDALSELSDESSLNQYKSTDIETELKNLEFCKILNVFFQVNRDNLLHGENILIEQMIKVFLNTEMCFADWSTCPFFRHVLLILKNNVEARSDTSDENVKEYLTEVYEHIEELNQKLYVENKPIYKDEL